MMIPPNLTMAANLSLLALMAWKRTKAAYLWLVMAPTLAGTAFLEWNEWRWSRGFLSSAAFNDRLDYSQHTQHFAELVAVLWLARCFRKGCTDQEFFLLAFAVMHLLTRLQEWLDWYSLAGDAFYLEGDIFNLLMIAAMAWVVFCHQRNRAQEEVWQ